MLNINVKTTPKINWGKHIEEFTIQLLLILGGCV